MQMLRVHQIGGRRYQYVAGSCIYLAVTVSALEITPTVRVYRPRGFLCCQSPLFIWPQIMQSRSLHLSTCDTGHYTSVQWLPNVHPCIGPAILQHSHSFACVCISVCTLCIYLYAAACCSLPSVDYDRASRTSAPPGWEPLWHKCSSTNSRELSEQLPEHVSANIVLSVPE